MTEANEDLKVTSLEDLKKVGGDYVVELPAFLDGTPFVAKLRRPSLLRMAQLGEIPDELQPVIDGLLQSNNDAFSMDQKANAFALIADKALVEPTFEQVTDIIDSYQLAVIWHWVVFGPAMLEPFRDLREVFSARAFEAITEPAEESDQPAETGVATAPAVS